MKYKFALFLLLPVLVVLTPSLAMAWPWSTDMMNQPNVKPQELTNGKLFEFAKRSVPTIGVQTKAANRDETKGLVNPVAATAGSMKIGKNLFKIYCSACHGMTGKADSPITPKIGAISLVDEYVQKQLTEGWIFGTITFGSAIMPAYGKPGEGGGSNDLSVQERWHVVNYVRNQLAKDAAASNVVSN